MIVKRNLRKHSVFRDMATPFAKYVVFATLTVVMCFNIFFGYKVNTNCDNKLELARLETYYKRLLEEKGKENNNIPKEPLEEQIHDTEADETREITTKEDHNLRAKKPKHNKNTNIAFETYNKHVDEAGYQLSADKRGNAKNVPLDSMKDRRKHDTLKTSKSGKTNKKLKKFRGLKVDWWYDICMQRTIKEQTWHPLLPKYPQRETRTLKLADDEKIVGSHFRRIYGYFYTKTSGYYDFKLMSRDGADLLLLDTSTPLKSVENVSSIMELPEVLYMSLGSDTMDYQDNKLNLSEMFSIEKRNIWLAANNLYFLEIIQGGRFFAKYQILWRTTEDDSDEYKTINKYNLMYTNCMSSSETPSRIIKKRDNQPRFPVRESEAIRLAFHKIPVLPLRTKLHFEPSFQCELHPQEKKEIEYQYQGYNEYTDNFLVYPKEHFTFISTDPSHIVMGKEQALDIAHKMFDRVNALYGSTLQLQHIVHIVTNVDKAFKSYEDWKRNLIFVELDVQRQGEDTTFRTSHFVQLSPDGLCFMEDHTWKEKVVVNIMTPIRNQVVWLKYLIQMLEEIVGVTHEIDYRLILIDNNSTDGDYQAILKKSKLKHLYLSLPIQKFNKVKALNFGLQYILDKDSIAFVLDLHLQIPLNMFDRIRKLTIQGKTAFSPSLLKLACGEHEQYTELSSSEWLDYGTGMIGMYKSDWSLIGGYNEKLFGQKWGGEDWEVIDRLFQNGLYLIHLRLPRFYHVHHSRQGMWDDGKKQDVTI